MKRNTICLVMIVRDEAANITNALNSVINYIDEYIILDTGSVDNTIEIIRNYFEERAATGKYWESGVFETEWKGHAAARTEALQLSLDICDYRLFIDADNIVKIDAIDNPFHDMTADGYLLKKIHEDVLELYVMFIFKSDRFWRYRGVIHEYPYLSDDELPGTQAILEGVTVHEVHKASARPARGPEHYHDDALKIERELIQNKGLEPADIARYWYYLGQSYKDAGMFDRAIAAFRYRVTLQGGWDQENYYALLSLTRLMRSTGTNIDHIISLYLTVWESRPHRWEAATDVMQILRDHKRYKLAAMVGEASYNAAVAWQQTDIMMIEKEVYNWRFFDELSLAWHFSGHSGKALFYLEKMKNAPAAEQQRLQENKKFFQEGITPPPPAATYATLTTQTSGSIPVPMPRAPKTAVKKKKK